MGLPKETKQNDSKGLAHGLGGSVYRFTEDIVIGTPRRNRAKQWGIIGSYTMKQPKLSFLHGLVCV